MPKGFLPGFKRVPSSTRYAELHKRLWPTRRNGGNCLSEYINTCEADLSIWNTGNGDNTSAMDVSQSIRYINLNEHDFFRVGGLMRPTVLIVRQEYEDFIAEVERALSADERRYFLTGQPGIGKSLGASYFLLYLLASGQSIFLIPDTKWIYYFSGAGADHIGVGVRDIGADPLTQVALRRSWVLIDVDLGPGSSNWLPEPWVTLAATLVWTASPQANRMHHFCKQLDATPWYMKSWSLGEITAMTTLTNQDPSNILQRLRTAGPVARSLFNIKEIPSAGKIDALVKDTLRKNPFNWGASELVQGTDVTHRIFLVEPGELLDEDGVDRQNPIVNFLTSYITSRTVKVMEEHVDAIREHLSQAFDNVHTRSAAGKLVESMFHDALIRRTISLQQTFSVGPVTAHLEILGKADDFVLETYDLPMRSDRPLYLRPQSSTFAAVDSILITATSVFLIQCTLGTSHSHVVPTLLRIISRLQASGIEVDSPSLTLSYCLLGTDGGRVRELLRQARTRVANLQTALQAQGVPAELEKLSKTTYQRLNRLQVQGVIFDTANSMLGPI